MKCRVCRGQRLELFLDLGDQPHCNSLLQVENIAQAEPIYPLQVFFCHDCTTVQIGYTVPKETMFSEYLYVSGTTRTLRAHFLDSANRLTQRLALQAGDLVVDIGSNDGTWLAGYPSEIRTLGVEPARNVAALANERGVPTLNRFFNLEIARDILAEHGHPRLVTAAGVFFHLEELHSVTAGIAELMGEQGVFCVQAIYLGEILRQTEFDNIYHEHLTYWTIRSLDALFEHYGLEIFSAGLLSIHGGSLELLVGRRGQHPLEDNVTAMRHEEKRLGYGEFETYQAFAQRVWIIRERLVAILRQYRTAGKTVYAFGAPAKGATLLNSFGLTTDLLACAVEANPLKVGRYIPGARLPIVDERQMPEPDAYLILPWNFLGEFLRKKRDYLLGGGAFIVPIPDPVVIDRHNYAAYSGEQSASA